MFGLKTNALVAAGALALGVAFAAGSASAATLTGTVGGVPNGTTYENFDSLALGSAGGVTASGISVSFNPDGQVVNGSSAGQYAAPFLSGGNGTNFGNPVNGADTTNYLSTGVGSVEMLLPGDMLYFGLLWGSVDDYNTLEFYDDATLVASFTGLDVDAAASGDQGAQGTFYVNITSDTAFNKVVASSSQYAFEFDNVSFNQTGPGGSEVPEPASLALLGAGLLGLGLARRRKSA